MCIRDRWWGALTQQFQQIAADAMKDVAGKTALDTARNPTEGTAKGSTKAASGKAAGGKKAAVRKRAG